MSDSNMIEMIDLSEKVNEELDKWPESYMTGKMSSRQDR